MSVRPAPVARPPRLAQLALFLFLRDPAARETICGDLDEEFAGRSLQGLRAARRWYWQQAVRSLSARAGAFSPLRGTILRLSGDLLHDLRLALRQWRRQPVFAASAIATLGIGIACATTTFAWLDAVVLRPLSYAEPDRLVMVGESDDDGGVGQTGFATYLDWREQTKSFEDLEIIRSWQPTLLGDEPEHLNGLRVSVGTFPMLGASPALGRAFLPEEDQPDRRRVVLLSDGLWRRRFGADPAVVGRVLPLAGGDFEVVGVMPPDFRILFPGYLDGADLWAPLGYRTDQPDACRTCRHLRVFGRLAPGVSVETARADLEAVHRDLAKSRPREYEGMAVGVDSVARALVGPAGPALWLLLGAVLLVLLVAGANVASLELARGARRVPELQVRAALGAEQRQIARMLITEGALLCIVAGGVGVALAAAAARAVVRLVPQQLPRLEDAGLDVRAVLFALVVTLFVAVVVLTATIAGARQGADPRVGGGARVVRGHGAWTRRLLVAGNLALAVALVHGAMLMTRTVTRLLRTETGFDSARVLSVQLTMLGPRYEEESSINRGIEQLLARVRALPGVESAAIASQVPLGGNFDGRGIEVEGRIYETAADMVSLQRYSVTDTYLETMRVGLVLGRGFEGADREGTEAVAVLSESAAQSLFRDQSPLGERIRTGGSDAPWRTVVGVVRDVRHVDLRTPALPSLYLPMAQFVDSFVTLVVRTSLPYDRQAEALRQAIAATLPDVPSYAVAPLEDLERRAAGLERFTGLLLAAFAAIALLLAAIGLYGLIAYLVEARRREVGIRVALGAARSSVAWLVLRPGVGLALVGFVVGASGALVLARAFGSLLYGVGPADPASLVLVACTLLAVALLAQIGPLRSALRLDPARSLRSE